MKYLRFHLKIEVHRITNSSLFKFKNYSLEKERRQMGWQGHVYQSPGNISLTLVFCSVVVLPKK